MVRESGQQVFVKRNAGSKINSRLRRKSGPSLGVKRVPTFEMEGKDDV